ncbi:unnamed protein product [Clavelina lepadiformis]|uniref:Protein ecdysoneless homolog n=1 Tax=Clavelina lepadiformis TaxID=159417 RepID=A0ABP0GAB2_CLALP
MMEELSKKQLPDDVVQYFIYVNPSNDDNAALEEKLIQYLNRCRAFVLSETQGHIWQDQGFNLKLVRDDKLSYLFGSTNYGDSIDDEWFVVHILFKMTEAFPGLIASVVDNDGQFLLIEAADYLPKWLTPDTSDNRIFISSDGLHVLLQPQTPGHVSFLPVAKPSIRQALNAVSNFPSVTKAPQEITSCIWKRIECFPQKAISSIQYVNVFVPRNIVYFLDQFPNFISQCVKAFYLRDPIDLRGCRQFKYFPPQDRVWTQLPMTRFHYAQLMQQTFIPDKRSGYKLDINLMPSERKGHELGMKIAHGFEIICFNASRSTKISSNSDDKEHSGQFKKFVDNLAMSGYFRGEIEGSKLYQNLYLNALNYYNEHLGNEDRGGGGQALTFLDGLKKLDDCPHLCNLEIYDKETDAPRDSKDQWMYLNDKEMETMVSDMNKGFANLHKNRDSTKFLKATERLHTFVEEFSEYDGVDCDDKSTLAAFDPDKMLQSLETLLAINDNASDTSDDFMSSEEELEDDEKPKLSTYMDYMDEELASTVVGESFVKEKDEMPEQDSAKSSNAFNVRKSDRGKLTDIDANLVENFILGQSAESGHYGPISNILNTAGARLHDE